MEKRFVVFLVLTLCLWTSYIALRFAFAPDKPVAQQKDEPKDAVEEDVGKEADAPATDAAATDKPEPDERPREGDPEAPAKPPKAATGHGKRIMLGSLDEKSGRKMLVTFLSRGAAVERVELAKYWDIEEQSGYLGQLALTDDPDSGAVVNIVGAGTPASLARAANGAHGLQPGDVITQANKQEILTAKQFEEWLQKNTRPEQSITLSIRRKAAPQPISFEVQLTRHPLEVVQPEWHSYKVGDELKILPQDPLSLLLTLETIGGKSVKPGDKEIAGLPTLLDGEWEIDSHDDTHVQFSYSLDEAAMRGAGRTGALKLIKRFTLPKADANSHQGYHLDLHVEVVNQGDSDLQVAYRLQGPTGLPLEGWWYSTKLHTDMFKGAGARDIVWRVSDRAHKLLGCPMIFSEAKEAIKKGEPPRKRLLVGDEPQSLDYVGVDTQFFASAVIPGKNSHGEPIKFRRAEALPVQDVMSVPKNRLRTTDVSFELVSEAERLLPGKSLAHDYQVFFGPKDHEVLVSYQIELFREFGWSIFKWPAIALQSVLNLLYSLVGNYGIAIILLTVIVRSCMIPISLKQARSAAMMQQLAPEMQKIKDKYPDDPLKQQAAVQELYKKHKFNPFGGCLLVFIQLPIFIGLYRCLSVDIDLRDAPLFSDTIQWASNLAGPDKLFYWKDYMPAFIGDEAAGWFGPFFNVFPLITVALFLVQQKMFMPPATDEQTKMQQNMMTWMTVLMGIMFYKVPAGLCVYFITSSLWGICERKLIAKKKKPAEESAATAVAPAKPSSNGAAKTASGKKQKKR